MTQFIETPRDKTKELHRVGKKNKAPKTIKVRTLIIAGALVASHAVAFVAGMQAKDAYNGIIERAVAERTAQAEEARPKDRAQQ